MVTPLGNPIAGTFIPIVTPMHHGEPDTESLAGLIEHVMVANPEGIYVFGTTGERLLLSEHEADSVLSTVVDLVAGRTDVYVAINGFNTRGIVAELARIAEAGYDIAGYLVGCPASVRPSQSGLLWHYTKVADSTELPIIIYNIPFRSGVNVETDTVLALAELPNIRGVKDVCRDVGQTSDLLARRPVGFSVLAGEDPTLFHALAEGADGAVVALANVAPKTCCALVTSCATGDLIAARAHWSRLWPLINALYQAPSPVGIKYALYRQGVLASPEPVRPLEEATPEERAAIDEVLAGFVDESSAASIVEAL
jgi:4-hydroxy-tetrahydrodipicolinate synthase